MSDVSKKEVEKATREYVEAQDAYHKLSNEFVKVPTRENLEKFKEAYAKADEALKKQHKLVLLYRGFSDA